MKPRGLLMILVVAVVFLCADLVQRTVIVGIIKLRPSAREGVLRRWLRGLADFSFWAIRWVGGAKFDLRACVPCRPGVILAMNHQSLLDIPIAVKSLDFEGLYPKIIARDRYRTGIPLVSHMIRLYDHPTVQPGGGGNREILKLRKLAETTNRPVVIYPEGSRSRDGEIKTFRTAGLKAMLPARVWDVYVVVADGLWQSTSIDGFIENVSSLSVRSESMGPFTFDPEVDDAHRFIEMLEERMRGKMDEIRGNTAQTKSPTDNALGTKEA